MNGAISERTPAFIQLQATFKVPKDAYKMDFVFSDVESGNGTYDSRGGFDYHLPVEGSPVSCLLERRARKGRYYDRGGKVGEEEQGSMYDRRGGFDSCLIVEGSPVSRLLQRRARKGRYSDRGGKVGEEEQGSMYDSRGGFDYHLPVEGSPVSCCFKGRRRRCCC